MNPEMPVPADAAYRTEPGSFRDRDGRVYYHQDAVLRGLSAHALRQWQELSAKDFFARFQTVGQIVRTRQIEPPLGLTESGDWAGWLEHERIPFVSYTYEWPFGMLQDATLLQLELLLGALGEDMVLKDASAYNVQWVGTRPVFIDIPSFESLSGGAAWTGYRQLCELGLYPLFLQAYKDVPFHPWLRGRLDGIAAEECWHVMSWFDLLHRGVFTHVYLQHKLQARYGRSSRPVTDELRSAGFSTELIASNARGLRQLVRGLSWRRSGSAWSEYAESNSYSAPDRERKLTFVRDALATSRPKLAWDLGCNTGTFSRLAAEYADYVIAMDADHLAVERLYQQLKAEHVTSILPLVNNLADPSPQLGWRLRERKDLADRGKPDMTLVLALLHHLVLGANIPLAELIDWLAILETDLVIEFVTKDDPMAQGLLRNKTDNYRDYEVGHFEALLQGRFAVQQRVGLASGTRILYYATYTH